MFEVVITLRSDFSEHVVARFRTEDEAQEEAFRVALAHTEKLVRAWVRLVREAQTQS